MTSVEESISTLPKTASTTITKLKSIGINTLFDLINYYPVKYKDYSVVSSVRDLSAQLSSIGNRQEVVFATIKGTVVKSSNRYLKKSLSIQTVVVDDGTGLIDCVWFRQPFILTNIKVNMKMSVSGAVRKFGQKLSINVDEYDMISDSAVTLSTCRLVPVYSEKRGLSTKTVRQKIYTALEMIGQDITDPLPDKIIRSGQLIPQKDAYKLIHYPTSLSDTVLAKKRLAFDELFTIQLSSKLVKQAWEKTTIGHDFSLKKHKRAVEDFIQKLPFKLTDAQNRVVKEVLCDLSRSNPANRLIQGDVGSGKTVIAAIASYACYLAGFKTLLMAPTEILASQHYATLTDLFKDLAGPSVSLVTGTVKGMDANIIVGTHALISAKSVFENVGLIIIDEQHKFGVVQRAMLKEKGSHPHLLTMTATPIPRSVCLTLYGELDLSIIDQMPMGRKTIKTYVVPSSKRAKSHAWIREQIDENGAQIFVVCPIIDESDHESMTSVKAVTQEYEKLKSVFSDKKVALLHGKMKAVEKAEIMGQFMRHEFDILVATQLVEVGVDVPNATIMVIESAERYGLSQLHQLRGRVGRNDKQSYCLLFTSQDDNNVSERLEFFASTSSGFKLAEYDLTHRGTGQIYGKRQHGTSDLVLASLTDTKLLENSRKSAEQFLEEYRLSDYPILERKVELQGHKHITQD